MTLSAADELGRSTRAYVSAYNRGRLHLSQLYAYETRCLVADFTGVTTKAIASATWKNDGSGVLNMSNAAITNKTTSVNIATGWPGTTRIRCTITTSTGEQYSQLFVVRIKPATYFSGDAFTANGTLSLTVTA